MKTKNFFVVFFLSCIPLLLGGCGPMILAGGAVDAVRQLQEVDRATGGAVSQKVESTVRENGGLSGLFRKAGDLVGGLLGGEKSSPSATSARRKAEVPFVRVKPEGRKIRLFPSGENPRVWSREHPFPPPDRESPPAVAGAAI